SGGAALVVAGEGWHPGVVGIVAAKLVERFHRPVAVLAGCADGFRGSVRAVSGFHAQRSLLRCQEHLDKFGGHAGAAGLTVSADRLEAFRPGGAQGPREMLQGGAAGVASRITVDAEVDLDDIDERVAEELARLGPFGMANPEPVLCARAQAERTRVVAKDHLQLVLRAERARRDAIAFRLAARDPG